jgi:hypothetical protein
MPSPTADTAAPFDPAPLEASVEALFAVLPELTLTPIWQVDSAMEAARGPVCPASTDRGWSDDCLTDDGTTFFGGLSRDDGPWELEARRALRDLADQWAADVAPGWAYSDDEPVTLAVDEIDGACQVDTADGRRLTMDGDFQDLRVTQGSVTGWRRTHGGPVRDDVAPTGWVAAGIVPEFVLTELVGPAGHARRLVGAIAGLDAPMPTAQTERLTWYDAPGRCTEPSGVVFLRDAAGQWSELRFEDCDGCATVYVLGELVGTACPDLSAALSPLQPAERP